MVAQMSDIYPAYTGDLEWLKSASCKGMPTDWWHPSQGRSDVAGLARAVCETCPHTSQCLEYGVETKSSGIYGGVLLRVGSLPRKRGKKDASK